MKRTISVFVPLLALAACTSNNGAPSPGAPSLSSPPEGAAPTRISIASTSYTFGFALGVPRTSVTVDAFEITKAPVSVGAYRKCIEAGICSVPSLDVAACKAKAGSDGATYADSEQAATLALTCATPTQASTYCAWVGGRLPTAAEWVLAARGTSVHRYAWGDVPASCDKRSRISYFADFPNACCGVECTSADTVALGRHDGVTSPFGLSDVLIPRGELLGPDPRAGGVGCGSGGPGCLVVSLAPGGIDGLAPLPTPKATQSLGIPVFSFRCAWPGETR